MPSPETRLSPELNPEEKTSLGVPTYIDTSSPIDQALVRYAREVESEATPSQAEQLAMIKAIRQSQPNSEQLFISRNEGLLATIVYPFKTQDPASDIALLESAAVTLIEAARLYSRMNAPSNFTIFAGPMVQDALIKQAPWFAHKKLLGDERHPTAAIYRFLSTLHTPQTAEEEAAMIEQNNTLAFEALMQKHKNTLQYIHLTNDEIVRVLGVSLDSIYDIINEFIKKFGIENRASLALACKDAGLCFVDIPQVPEAVQLTPVQRRVAPHLHKTFTVASTETNIDVRAFNKVSSELRKKLGARSRTELVLMIHGSHLLEESNEEVHPALKAFTPHERAVLSYLYLDTPDIMDRLSLTDNGVYDAISRAHERSGTTNRRELALHLFSNGLAFDIKPPSRPIHELFDTEQLSIVSNLHLPNEVLAEQHAMPLQRLTSLIHWLQKKAGARTRIELMLMARQYDTGERRERDTRSKQEKLASKLGLTALDLDVFHKHLETIGYRQRVLISSYYFSDESVTWRTVAQEHNLDRTLAIVTARAGVLRIKKKLEESKSLHPTHNGYIVNEY